MTNLPQTSSEKKPFTICSTPIIHLVWCPKFCITIFRGITSRPKRNWRWWFRKILRANKVHQGRCANGERHIMFLSSNCLLFRKSGLFSLKKILRLHDYNFMLRFWSLWSAGFHISKNMYLFWNNIVFDSLIGCFATGAVLSKSRQKIPHSYRYSAFPRKRRCKSSK